MIDTSALYSLLFCVLIFALARKWKRSPLPYPPGPKGYPILGNVLDLSMSVPIWENFTSLSNRLGTDVMYLRLMGEDVVVLSSNEAITDVVEKRSAIYSERPHTPMMKLTGTTEWMLVMMSYGARWRVRHRLFQEVLGPKLTGSFDDHQSKYVHRFLSRLLEEPKNFIQDLEFTPGAIILAITYGIDVKSVDDPLLIANLEAGHAMATALVPGKFLVDAIPMLRYVPDWFPGTGFKAIAKESVDKFKISCNIPLEYVKNALKSGKGFSHSIASDCLSRLEDDEKTAFDEEAIRDVSGNMFAAAAETTRSSLKAFFLAMALNPEVMKKGQEELDRVVGKGHLPDYSDKENLPYIDALVKELLRWNPPAPISVPNKAMQDDVYRGYFIPAGATIIQNVWAICRDPNVYPDPEAFNPDRFLKDGKINPLVLDPASRVFGAGRRICPGRHLALRTVYLVVVCVLSAFDIGPALDENGNPQAPKVEYDNAAVRDIKPFECTIKPRSDDAIKLVREACDRTHY